MILRIVVILAALGYAVGAYFEPDYLLPSAVGARVLLALLFLLLFTVPIQTAYRLRTILEQIPDVDRERIYELRALAGRATDLYARLTLLPPPPRTTGPIEELREAGSRLRHYPDLYRAADKLAGILWVISPATGATATFQEWSGLVREAQDAYSGVIAECDAVLGSSETAGGGGAG